MLIQIIILIIVVIGAVHVVHKHGVKAGIEAGITKGRLQILEENLLRINLTNNDLSVEVSSFIENESQNQYSRKACKYVPKENELSKLN